MFGNCGMRRLRSFLKDRIGNNISKRLTDSINDSADCLVVKSLRRSDFLPMEHVTKPMGIVVIYLQQEKGWLFYIPTTNKLVPSAWAEFLDSRGITNILFKGPPEGNPNNMQEPKMGLPFILNSLELRHFENEETFMMQEKMAETITEPKGKIPRSYREAMSGSEKGEWTSAIRKELKNM
ncbi:hypothetical protein O181_000807 [Austropuccinia psidii MF-1]|uniref:Uncharacterized protein n=1 Tax=Austropuccinia psidii MF-1 TaxID=1389203 RepID=A0A9Q3B9D1_9BASI|nr:hypothetical protein [Austropuccinia psidii MF-1]